MDEYKTLESLLKNRNAILEFFYTRHIFEECRNLTLNTDDSAQKDDDFEEIDYD